MKTVILGVFGLVLAISSSASAARLADAPGFEYDVRFTNPRCREYRYDRPVQSVSGNQLLAKPQNVYCTHGDSQASAERSTSVQSKLLQWVNDPSTKEVFFAYLSFSNSVVREALCKAARDRGVKIQMVLDSGTDLGAAQALVACSPANVKLETRGNVGGLGYAHNKVFIINPRSRGKMQLVFSSGNLSSGVVLHHENWHFITAPVTTHFMQAHLCLMNGMLDHGRSKAEYSAFIRSCRQAIPAPAEEDIQAYFVPAEGDAAGQAIVAEIGRSSRIAVAAHRFSYRPIIDALARKLGQRGSQVRFVADDDMYWVGTTREAVGPNLAAEYRHVAGLVRAGAQAKWMETNHPLHLLHHNKYLVLDDRKVFTGAGNLTGAGFSTNYENYYMISIPSVVQAFNAQYEHVWNDLATAPANMPATNVLPGSR